MESSHRLRQYWHSNLRVLAILLTIWFGVSFGAGILFVDQLDAFRIFGFRLGFWFAQQGSIYVFVLLILVYVKLMNRLDQKYEVDEQDQLTKNVNARDTAAGEGAR